jgi:hypothetical protein
MTMKRLWLLMLMASTLVLTTASAEARDTARRGGDGNGRHPNRPSREEVVRRFDKDGDGKLTGRERRAAGAAKAAARGKPGTGGKTGYDGRAGRGRRGKGGGDDPSGAGARRGRGRGHGGANGANGRGNVDPDDNPPGPRGGEGTNWENPPGHAGGHGASPDRRGDGGRGSR